MTTDKYNTIVELAKQGLSGIEIVQAINAADGTEEKTDTKDTTEKLSDKPDTTEKLSDKTDTTETDKQAQILEQMQNLEKRITALSETFNAVNILNSEQPVMNLPTAQSILSEVFAGVTEVDNKK